MYKQKCAQIYIYLITFLDDVLLKLPIVPNFMCMMSMPWQRKRRYTHKWDLLAFSTFLDD